MYVFTFHLIVDYICGGSCERDLYGRLLSGTTPQRRDFSYPRLLTKTSPHEKIVEEFRKKYIEQEAVDTALPSENDSDEDVVSRQIYGVLLSDTCS